MGLFGGAKSIVGLDIGSSCIKVVELKRSKGEISVATLGVEPLSADIVVDSMIVDSGSVSAAISKIFTDHKIKSKMVATSVSGNRCPSFFNNTIDCWASSRASARCFGVSKTLTAPPSSTYG